MKPGAKRIISCSLSFQSLYHYATWQVRDSNTLFNQTAVDCFATFWVGIEGAVVQIVSETG